ncbi:hypothetical protein GCM10010446_06350 [Streptomyces enissocaesilis]|uniref:Uncharacterized protein n=1 Tax=Streptomyces enissocaesilis TaxID=332589 RepID=A0ABN3WUB2_9ACTN
MAAVGDALRHPATEERHEERAERDEDRHVLLLVDRPPAAHIRDRTRFTPELPEFPEFPSSPNSWIP